MMPSMARTWSRTDSAGGGRSEQEDVPDSWEDETWSPQRINASLRAQQEARTNRDTFESEQISTPSLESSFANQLQIVEEEEENAARRSDVSALPCDSLVDGANGESHESTIVTAEDMDEWEGFCAICLEEIALAEMATIPTCEHSFCVNCVLTWSTYLEVSRCPKCKVTFSYLWVYRNLEGELSDYPVEESVTLLLRASWFHPTDGTELHAPNAADVDEDSEDDSHLFDEFEEAALSGRRGRKNKGNIILGNRPYGNGGFMSAGRSSARPVQPNKQPKPHGEKKGNQKAEQSKKGKRQRQANEQLPQASQK